MQHPVSDIQYVGRDEDADATLMQRVACGDEKAFQKLLRRHLASAVRLASRVLGNTSAAEDIAQQAFIRVWQHAGNFEDPEKKGARFSTWLYRIVVNLCIDEKRKRKFDNIEDLPELVDGALDAEKALRQKEQAIRVREALQQLPERQRMAFVLCFYEGYSNKEAADMMGIGLKAVESLLVRARKFLREALQEERLS